MLPPLPLLRLVIVLFANMVSGAKVGEINLPIIFKGQ